MMEPLPEALPLLARERLSDAEDPLSIYTHSAKSRYLVLSMFGSYLVFFTYFTNFARNKILELNKLPDPFLNSGDFPLTQLLTYLIGGLGWFFAIVILAYFIYAVIDFWGLQVCVNNREIRVQNTILGQAFSRYTGVGIMAMDEIETIRPKSMFTHLHAGANHVRFSPVDRLESLISTILANAKHAKIID